MKDAGRPEPRHAGSASGEGSRHAANEQFGPGPVSAPTDAVEAVNRRAEVEDLDEPPPVGVSWTRLYTGVILTLLLVIVALTLFERAYRP